VQIYEEVLAAAWDFDPSRGVKFNTVATEYIINRWYHSVSAAAREIPLVTFDDEGDAVTADVEDAQSVPVLEHIGNREDIQTRLDELRAVLAARLNDEERAIFCLANGLDPVFSQPVRYEIIAAILFNRMLKPKIVSPQAIEQQLRNITDRVIQLLNVPSENDLTQWALFVQMPNAMNAHPPAIRRNALAEGIPVVADILLEGYEVPAGRPVIVSAISSISGMGSGYAHYIILAVSYHGKSIGSSLLKFNYQGNLLVQVRKDTREETKALLDAIYLQELESNPADNNGHNYPATIKPRNEGRNASYSL
jgi:hypothetical protein